MDVEFQERNVSQSHSNSSDFRKKSEFKRLYAGAISVFRSSWYKIVV